MSEQNNTTPPTCETALPDTPIEESGSLTSDTIEKASGRRASFAAPASEPDKKRSSGGLDSLGQGHLP